MTRALYALVLVLLLTGCASLGNTDPTEVSRTTEPTPRASTTVAESIQSLSDCEYQDLPYQADESNSSAYPEIPSVINPNTLKNFSRDFEKAWAYNDYYEYNADIDVFVSAPNITSKDSRYLVTIELVTVTTETDDSISDAEWSTTYYIGDQMIKRATGPSGSPPESIKGERNIINCS